jgi:integrase
VGLLEALGDSCDDAEARVYPITGNALRLAWERVKRRAGIEDLRFHDLRHEAISRFFEKGLSVPEVASISGHRDLRMLQRYAHARNEVIIAKLDGD